MSKKFIVKVVAGRSRFDALQMMHNLAALLYNSHNIQITNFMHRDNVFMFETPNCIVRYVNTIEMLAGLVADEIFGCSPAVRKFYRKSSYTEPYDGEILDYILEVEKAAAENAMNSGKEPEQKEEYDILEFLENVMGLELTDLQKDMVKTFKKLHDDNCRVVYGRGGKIHVVPVESED